MCVAWQSLQEEAPEVDGIDDFVSYCNSTCIRGQYRIQQWNYFDYYRPRTNNHIKGWQKKIVGRLHPNICDIIDAMKKKKEQACTELKMEQFESGATQPAQKKRYVHRDRRIKTLLF